MYEGKVSFQFGFVYGDGVTNKYVHKEVLHQSKHCWRVDAFREHRPSWQRKPKAQQHGWSNRTRCLQVKDVSQNSVLNAITHTMFHMMGLFDDTYHTKR